MKILEYTIGREQCRYIFLDDALADEAHARLKAAMECLIRLSVSYAQYHTVTIITETGEQTMRTAEIVSLSIVRGDEAAIACQADTAIKIHEYNEAIKKRAGLEEPESPFANMLRHLHGDGDGTDGDAGGSGKPN